MSYLEGSEDPDTFSSTFDLFEDTDASFATQAGADTEHNHAFAMDPQSNSRYTRNSQSDYSWNDTLTPDYSQTQQQQVGSPHGREYRQPQSAAVIDSQCFSAFGDQIASSQYSSYGVVGDQHLAWQALSPENTGGFFEVPRNATRSYDGLSQNIYNPRSHQARRNPTPGSYTSRPRDQLLLSSSQGFSAPAGYGMDRQISSPSVNTESSSYSSQDVGTIGGTPFSSSFDSGHVSVQSDIRLGSYRTLDDTGQSMLSTSQGYNQFSVPYSECQSLSSPMEISVFSQNQAYSWRVEQLPHQLRRSRRAQGHIQQQGRPPGNAWNNTTSELQSQPTLSPLQGYDFLQTHRLRREVSTSSRNSGNSSLGRQDTPDADKDQQYVSSALPSCLIPPFS